MGPLSAAPGRSRLPRAMLAAFLAEADGDMVFRAAFANGTSANPALPFSSASTRPLNSPSRGSTRTAARSAESGAKGASGRHE